VSKGNLTGDVPCNRVFTFNRVFTGYHVKDEFFLWKTDAWKELGTWFEMLTDLWAVIVRTDSSGMRLMKGVVRLANDQDNPLRRGLQRRYGLLVSDILQVLLSVLNKNKHMLDNRDVIQKIIRRSRALRTSYNGGRHITEVWNTFSFCRERRTSYNRGSHVMEGRA